MKFLEKLADEIIRTNEKTLDKICIVLPNRRAGLYLKKHLAKKIDSIIWAPAIFSIEDFVCTISGLESVDNTTLLFDLYYIYQKIEGEKAQKFDEFLNWGSILLNDYSDCDINLSDTEKIFQYLNEAKAVNLWNPENLSLTEHEKNYLSFYNSLSKYYTEYTTYLLQKNCGYQGLIYKKATEKIDLFINECVYSEIIFGGFNALTQSEEKIIKTLIDAKKARIFWDTDAYYMENPLNEAGDFLRRYKNEGKAENFNWEENNFKQTEKNISIIGIPSNVGQAQMAGQIISNQLSIKENPENTALVLADETLLTPVLFSLPDSVKEMNITMGYPLANSPLHSLFKQIFNLCIHAAKYSKDNQKKYYQKDLIAFFNHPYLQIISQENESIAKLIYKLKNSNRIFYSSENILQNLHHSWLTTLFANSEETPLSMLEIFTSFILYMKGIFKEAKNSAGTNYDIDNEYLYHYAIIINKLKDYVKEYPFISDLKTLDSIFASLAESTSIPFFGEPLKGLQIMGMLETRSLDFDTIILLSVNENKIPSAKFQNTFIPYDIRIEMGLSTYKHKESIFAYHFYRLLQRAKQIFLIYNIPSNQFNSGEKSRYITQLLHELPSYNNKIKIQQHLFSEEKINTSNQKNIIVEKTNEIQKTILNLLKKGLSPSSLNTYISCQLKFYFQQIIQLKEPENIAETIDAATLGSVVHFALQELYTPFIGKNITKNDIEKMNSLVSKYIKEGFQKYYPDGDIETGKNLLISSVANKFIDQFLLFEKKHIEKLQKENKIYRIVQLEKYIEKNIEVVNENNEKINVKIKGLIDRIDSIDDTIRIIDYKTGYVAKEDLTWTEWDDFLTNPNLSKGFQILLYSYILHDQSPLNDMIAGIISFRKIQNGFMELKGPGIKNNIIEPETHLKTEEIIKQLILSLLNPNNAFIQTEDNSICINCAYNQICNK